MLGLTFVLYWLVTDETFRVTPERVEVRGVRYADAAEVRSRLGRLDQQPNVFRVRAADVVGDLRTMPEVAGARVSTSLPGRVIVEVEEREPILLWRSGDQGFLVDVEGRLFAPATAATGDEIGSGATGGALPAVEDDRLLAAAPAVGAMLGPEDMSVLRQLLGLVPEQVGSVEGELRLRIDERLGYVLEAPGRWYAVFGHYSPTARPPDIVPRQVQCLAALLSRREEEVGRVNLAVGPGGACGTYLTAGPARRGGGGGGETDAAP
jgi:hypothetical protein